MNDTNSSKPKKKKRDKKKNHWKDKKDNSPDPSLSDDSDLYYNSDYRRKQLKRKIDRKKGPDKIMRTFNGKVANDSI